VESVCNPSLNAVLGQLLAGLLRQLLIDVLHIFTQMSLVAI
jgi:hypothetical protein